MYIGAYRPIHESLEDLEDEIRISNYAKRDFEMVGSARRYSAFTNVLGREVELTNKSAHEIRNYDLLERRVTSSKETVLTTGAATVSDSSYVSRAEHDNLGQSSALRCPRRRGRGQRPRQGGTEIGLIGNDEFAGAGGVYGRQAYLSEADSDESGRLARVRFGNGVENDLHGGPRAAIRGRAALLFRGAGRLVSVHASGRPRDPLRGTLARYVEGGTTSSCVCD